MEDPNLSEVSPSIESLVHEIETRANKADDHVIAAALRLRDLRKRIESGELGENVKWLERAPLNFRKISISRLYELNAIAEADDKRAELERQREKNREKVKKHRETKAALERAMEPERKMLAAWLKTAPIEDVRMTFRQIVMKKHAADPSITLSSFIISNTPSHTMRLLWAVEKTVMDSRNILFQDEDKSSYVREMIDRIVASSLAGDAA